MASKKKNTFYNYTYLKKDVLDYIYEVDNR